MTDTNSQRNEDPKNVCSDGSLLHGTYQALHNPTHPNLKQNNFTQDDGEELIDDDFVYNYIDQLGLSDNVGDALFQNDFENIKKKDFPNYLKELTESGEAPFVPLICQTRLKVCLKDFWSGIINSSLIGPNEKEQYLTNCLNLSEDSQEIKDLFDLFEINKINKKSTAEEVLKYCNLALWGIINVNRRVLDLLEITIHKSLIAPEKPITENEFNKFLKKDILYFIKNKIVDIANYRKNNFLLYKKPLEDRIEKNIKKLNTLNQERDNQERDSSKEAYLVNKFDSLDKVEADSKSSLKNSNQTSHQDSHQDSMTGSNSSVKSMSI